MQDYAVNHDVNHFGKDNDGTKGVVETVPFVVQTTSTGTLVNIGIVSGGHGTHVAGTVAGKGFFGGQFDGVAPNAQLAVARVCLFITGCFTSDQVRAFNYLITVDKVNIIQMSIGGLPALNDDANDAEAQIVDNMTKAVRRAVLLLAGERRPRCQHGRLAGHRERRRRQRCVPVTGHVGGELRQQRPEGRHAVDVLLARPREDGCPKPNIVSPGSELSTWPAWNMSENPFAGGVGARPYQLPPGYEMIQGTSMASPMTAGAGALLISAALQNGFTPTPAQLQKSLYSSARYLNGYQAYEQGNGLTQVGPAWEILKTKPATPAITSTAPINTKISQLIAPYDGYGIYEREGWKPGDSGDRTITFSSTDARAGHVQPELARQRRDVLAPSELDHDPGDRLVVGAHRPGVGGDPQRDPASRRSELGRARVRDAEHDHRGAAVLRPVVLDHAERHGRPRRQEVVLRQRRGRHAGAPAE